MASTISFHSVEATAVCARRQAFSFMDPRLAAKTFPCSWSSCTGTPTKKFAVTTLIVESLADKYLEHQPIERQCLRWSRTGVDIAPRTLGRSVTAAIDALSPIARKPSSLRRS